MVDIDKFIISMINSLKRSGYHWLGGTMIVALKDQGLEYKEGAIQGEQKPTDKVEPKFKNGQWIVFNGLTLYVNEVVQGYYRTISIGGITNSYDWDIDNIARLWTIQDAKDGDVLAYENEIFIVKKSVNLNIIYYCCYDREHFIIDSIYSLTIDDIDNIRPASKEQRDQLKKAMLKAGYKWDAEKKDLKKIEQKSAEWSEEDEHWRQKAIDFMKHPDLIKATPTLAKDTITWLESLKDKVQPQTKQGWSEEDEQMIRNVQNDYHNRLGAGIITKAYHDKVISWLKSLSPRGKWKPSDEQMLALEAKITIPPQSPAMTSALIELYEQLKKLREE